MTLTDLPRDLAVHTEWVPKRAGGSSWPTFVYLVHTRRRLVLLGGLVVLLLVAAATFLFPSVAMVLAGVSVAIVVALGATTRGGGAGIYEVCAGGELRQVEGQRIDHGGLRRVRRRWL